MDRRLLEVDGFSKAGDAGSEGANRAQGPGADTAAAEAGEDLEESAVENDDFESILVADQVVKDGDSRTLVGSYHARNTLIALIVSLLVLMVFGLSVPIWGARRAKPQEPPQEPLYGGDPLEGGLVDGFCGITSNPGLCTSDIMYLRELSPNHTAGVFCKELSGEDPCSLSMNDVNYGLDKDPLACDYSPAVIYLWDHPGATEDETGIRNGEADSGAPCGARWQPSCAEWAARMWRRYADKWHTRLDTARRIGARVASPRFQGRTVLEQFTAFFTACPECSQQDSRYYIDILGFNAYVNYDNFGGIVGSLHVREDIAWIKDVAAQLKKGFANRPVVLTNVGTNGTHYASTQAELIAASGLFKKGDSALDAVYYFAGVDFHTTHNFLQATVGMGEAPYERPSIGDFLLATCNGLDMETWTAARSSTSRSLT